MTAWKRFLKGLAVSVAAVAVMVVLQPPAVAKDKDKEQAAQAPQANYSKEYRKLGVQVQNLVNEKKWAEVLAALSLRRLCSYAINFARPLYAMIQ